MDILLATSNPHKVREVRQILEPLGIFVSDLARVSRRLTEPEETGDTFQANARLKARGYALQTHMTCLAEDSGLEVDALGGAPGVYSARYAGTSGTREQRDHANNEKLLGQLAHVPPERRTARFVCAVALANVQGEIIAETLGTYEGIIAGEPRGTGGFGYDPLLYLPDLGLTSAELDPQLKHSRSHRGVAIRRLAEILREWQANG